MGMIDRIRARRKSRREAGNVEEQFYGGSADAANRYRSQFDEMQKAGVEQANAGVQRANDAADEGTADLSARSSDANQLLNRSLSEAKQADRGFGAQMENYNAGRGAILGNASMLERFGANAAQEYQQTADKQFAVNQDRNQRSALSMAAGRGAAGLRAALASSSQANADAAAQTEIARAQEFNDMNQQRQAALVNAANIRSGVGAQDQGAAAQYSGRQLQYDANALGANAQGADIDTRRAGIGQAAGALQAQTGVSQQGAGLGALTGMEESQLGSAQQAATATAANQAAKQDRRIRMFTDPFMGFNRSN